MLTHVLFKVESDVKSVTSNTSRPIISFLLSQQELSICISTDRQIVTPLTYLTQYVTKPVCFTLPWSLRAHLHVVGMLWFMPLTLTELTHSSLFRSCVYFCLYDPFNCILFHKFPWQWSVFSLCSSGLISVLLVLSTLWKSLSALI